MLLAIFLSGLIWWLNAISSVDKNNALYQNFTIQKGAGLRKIALDLKEDGLIRNPFVFLIVVKIMGIDGSVQAGEFELSPSMDAFTIAKKLTHGNSDVRITFPEGKRAEEVAAILNNHMPGFSGDSTITELKQYEGYLFPDTYYFAKNASLAEIIGIMINNFETKYASINSTTMDKKGIVTIASMIEREAHQDDDRPLVASVIYNRLAIGMKLDIDATVQYALGYNQSQSTWWKKRLSANDLTIDSYFNTYTNPGLPPAPIANPGLASLQAAANPTDTDYLYYFTDKNGINHYARTLAEQNENINRYGL